MTVPFTKPATSYTEQVTLLQRRGMTVTDPTRAELWLEQINYYRLTAYWLPYEADLTTHQFKPGTDFDTILGVYFTDRELRLLFLDAIERIEVSVRAHWAYQMAHRHGPHAHLDASLTRDPKLWLKNMSRLSSEIDRSTEKFISHMTGKYQELAPPVWASCEVMSLGLLSNWYGNLKPMGTRSEIAKAFGLDHETLASWLHHLSIVRNLCAHHSRLWNRSMSNTPRVPANKPAILKGEFVGDDPATGARNSRKLYNTCLLTLHLMDVVAPDSGWRQRLVALLTRGQLTPAQMGFPNNWQTKPIWR